MANVQRSTPIGSIERDFFLPRLAYPGGAQHDLRSSARGDTCLQGLSALEVTEGFYQYADPLYRHFFMVVYKPADGHRTVHETLISASLDMNEKGTNALRRFPCAPLDTKDTFFQ